ncbi:MAG: hypothetical protein KAR06_02660 [Deltaproteobacteria bacterium]|nr:hypothetical protein [Deltaproteobacteria bacterium]
MITVIATNPGPNINRWFLGYWTGTEWKSDAQFYPIDSPIAVPLTNYLHAYTGDPDDNLFGAYYSANFASVDGRTYVYDILTGVVTEAVIGPAKFSELIATYSRRV